MAIDDPKHRPGGDASMRIAVGGTEAADLSDLRFDLLCGLACRMFGMAAATIRVQGASKVWHAAAPAAQPDACHTRLPAEDGCPVASLAFGAGEIGLFSLFGPSSRAFGESELRQFEQFAALAEEQLRLLALAQGALRRESDFRQLAEVTTDTIIRGDLNGVRLYVSPSVQDLLGYTPEELIGHRALELTHPDDAPAFRALMQEIKSGRQGVCSTEQRQRHKDGSWVWLEASIRLTADRNTGQPDGYVASVRNIEHRKQLEAQLKHLAEVDNLTGLPNRTAFFACLDLSIEQALQSGEKFILLYMDLDAFKPVNDTFGHGAGDMVLRETAARLQASLRDSDRVFRLGGDEFTVLSVGAGGASSIALAQRLIAEIARPFAIDTAGVSVGMSVGIACWPEHGQKAEQLLECADQALYRAKKAGKNTARLYDANAQA